MSDRLALALAIEDAGFERAKAERIASTIVNLIHDNVATKADISELRGETRQVETSLRAEIGRVETSLNGRIDLIEHRLFTRLGSLIVVMAGAVIAGLHYWPPH